jgi:hypothetical protein
MKSLFKNILIFSLLIVIIIPVFVRAADPIIPKGSCGETLPGGGVNRECGYEDLIKLVNNIIDWIIIISAPVAAGVFAWAGITYMTTGVADQKSYAKSMMTKVFIGFVVILAAWIIVTTITNVLLTPAAKSAVPVEGVK